MSGTTLLGELPTAPSQNENIPVVQVENIQISNPLQQQISSRETDINKPVNDNQGIESYNELIAGLQNASQSGQTQLPDRNISQDTTSITNDEKIQQEYVPPVNNEKYIENSISPDEVLNYNQNIESQNNNFEKYYQEFQLPILIAVLYFLFQLPIIQKYLYKIIPNLFKSDGNPNFFGYLINSIVFGTSFYFLLKGLNYFSSI
jgi:hypothetical protein